MKRTALILLAFLASGCGSAHRLEGRVTQPTASPDGRRVAWVLVGTHIRAVQTLDVATKKVSTLYSEGDCCSEPIWVTPNELVFDDDFQVEVQPLTGHARMVADWSNLDVTNDHRWLIGFRAGHAVTSVQAIRLRDLACFYLPHPPHTIDNTPALKYVGHATRAHRRVVSLSAMRRTTSHACLTD